MSDEKRIKQLAKDIYDCGDALESVDFIYGAHDDSHFARIARKLVAKGYVKKEDLLEDIIDKLELKYKDMYTKEQCMFDECQQKEYMYLFEYHKGARDIIRELSENIKKEILEIFEKDFDNCDITNKTNKSN